MTASGIKLSLEKEKVMRQATNKFYANAAQYLSHHPRLIANSDEDLEEEFIDMGLMHLAGSHTTVDWNRVRRGAWGLMTWQPWPPPDE